MCSISWGEGMTRFILVTFGFLGWVFYEASGGADYAPRPGYAQATPVLLENTEEAPVENAVTRNAVMDNTSVALVSETDGLAGDADVDATAQSALEAAVLAAVMTPEVPAKVEVVVTNEPIVQEQRVRVTLAVAEDEPVKTEALETAPVDLRAVSGNRVNLREGPGRDFSVVSRLKKGTTVMVLEDPGQGWVQLQVVPGGSVGWMADWLLTKDG